MPSSVPGNSSTPKAHQHADAQHREPALQRRHPEGQLHQLQVGAHACSARKISSSSSGSTSTCASSCCRSFASCASVQPLTVKSRRAALHATLQLVWYAQRRIQLVIGTHMDAHDGFLQLVQFAPPDQRALAQHPDVARHPLQVANDVRRVQQCAGEFARNGEDLLHEATPRHRVQARCRLIQHQQVGLVAQRTQRGKLLAFTSRQSADAPREWHFPLARQPIDQRLVPARMQRGNQPQLLGAGQQPDQFVVLRHEANARLGRGRQSPAVGAEHTAAAARGQRKAQQQIKKCGLARAVLADQAHHLPRRNVGGEIAQAPCGRRCPSSAIACG